MADKRESSNESRAKMEERIKESGQLEIGEGKKKIHLLSVIGEIEGHDVLPDTTKSTKYEHVLPALAELEENEEIGGMLILINTVGGDVEAGLAIAEMIASVSMPTVSLVLGGSHSIGMPIAVSTDYSFIVPTGTMVIHPVRLNGMILGVRQSFDYFKQIQERIVGFTVKHSHIQKERLEQLMMETGVMTKDLGTILIGGQTVEEGLIDEVGGIRDALAKLRAMMNET